MGVDEVHTRIGRMFAYEHYGVAPESLCMAKSMSSGVILADAVVASEAIFVLLFDNPYAAHVDVWR